MVFFNQFGKKSGIGSGKQLLCIGESAFLRSILIGIRIVSTVERCPSRASGVIPEETGFIYIIENRDKKVKIGKSKRPRQRTQVIQFQGGFKAVNIFISAKMTDYDAVENRLHHHFRKYQYIGEWFDISFNEAVDAYHEIADSANYC